MNLKTVPSTQALETLAFEMYAVVMSEDNKEKEHNIKIKKLPNSEIEIEGEISTEKFESYYKKALQRIGKDAELPGFRKGHVPEKILLEKIGESGVLQEMAQLALADFYPRVIVENNIEAIGRPDITITKIARGNPFGFKAKTAVLSSFDLPDYKSSAKEALRQAQDEKVFVEEKEVEDVVLNIRKQYVAAESKEQEQGNTQLPELNDEFVKKLGNFQTVDEFKKKIKENLTHEKEMRAKEKKRIAIIDCILKETKISLPAILVEGELDRMLTRFKGNISAMGQKFEDYLAQIKKTEAEMREGWRADAEKSAKTQLLLQKISEMEKITIPEEELQKEIGHLSKHHPKADKERMRQYVEGLLLHEKVFQLLEG